MMGFCPTMPIFNMYGMQNFAGAQMFGFPQLFAPQNFVNSCFASFGYPQNYSYPQYNLFPQMFNFNMGMYDSYNTNPFQMSNFGFNYNQNFNPFALNNFNGLSSINRNTNVKTNNASNPGKPSSIGLAVRDKAKSYVGKVNSSAEGNALFSPKGYQNTGWYKKYGRWGWCADFAVYCAKDVMGDAYPKDMKTSSPDGLGGAAKKHNAYLAVPSSNREQWLANNIKPGNIIHMKGRGDSGQHIAVVDYVKGGKIHAISGNSSGKVREVDYDINTSGIYGFIDLDKLSA